MKSADEMKLDEPTLTGSQITDLLELFLHGGNAGWFRPYVYPGMGWREPWADTGEGSNSFEEPVSLGNPAVRDHLLTCYALGLAVAGVECTEDDLTAHKVAMRLSPDDNTNQQMVTSPRPIILPRRIP